MGPMVRSYFKRDTVTKDDFRVWHYQNLLDTHANAVKRYHKATDGYKRGHERTLRNAMSDLLRAEVK
jgi:hypothetical protein